MPALAQEILQLDDRARDLGRVVRRIGGEPHFVILKTVQDLGDGDGMDAYVVDGANGAAFGNHETKDEARCALLRLQAEVVKAVGIPQLHEVAAQRLFAVEIARLGDDHGLEHVLGDPAVAAKLDGLHVLAGGRGQLRLGRSLGDLQLGLAGGWRS